jgi:hypothetical protein
VAGEDRKVASPATQLPAIRCLPVSMSVSLDG